MITLKGYVSSYARALGRKAGKAAIMAGLTAVVLGGLYLAGKGAVNEKARTDPQTFSTVANTIDAANTKLKSYLRPINNLLLDATIIDARSGGSAENVLADAQDFFDSVSLGSSYEYGKGLVKEVEGDSKKLKEIIEAHEGTESEYLSRIAIRAHPREERYFLAKYYDSSKSDMFREAALGRVTYEEGKLVFKEELAKLEQVKKTKVEEEYFDDWDYTSIDDEVSFDTARSTTNNLFPITARDIYWEFRNSFREHEKPASIVFDAFGEKFAKEEPELVSKIITIGEPGELLAKAVAVTTDVKTVNLYAKEDITHVSKRIMRSDPDMNHAWHVNKVISAAKQRQKELAAQTNRP